MNIDLMLTKAEALIRKDYPTATLRFDEAEDESVDDGATLLIDGKETEITVQIGYRYFGVNEWLPEEEAMQHHYMGPSMDAAARTISELLSARN